MPNTNVFRGSDATLTLASEDTPEGQAAKEIIEFYNLSPVGRAVGVEVHIQTELELFHELGKRAAAALRPGNIHISGSVDRAFVNGALIRLLLGKGALPEREAEPYPQPSFNLMIDLKDPAIPTTSSTMIVHKVKFDDWCFKLPEDDFCMERVTFKGLFVTIEDKEGT